MNNFISYEETVQIPWWMVINAPIEGQWPKWVLWKFKAQSVSPLQFNMIRTVTPDE